MEFVAASDGNFGSALAILAGQYECNDFVI